MALTKSAPSQQFVPLKEVRDGIAILKDGSMRALLLTSSLNFALKSTESQEAIIYQFQNFLNSLDFTVQIFVSSRRLDIRPYIALLENRYKEQTGELLRLQTREYIEFIKKFTESANIMTKSFFVVVPYSSSMLNKDSASGLFAKKDRVKEAAQKSEAFEEVKSQIQQRVSVVEQGLTRVGIRVAQLGTEEIIELFYKIFNPGETDKPIQL
ncbi:MAG: hypothetical protein WCO79_00175 [bacterium]